jgi:hypothetical protein
MTQIPTVKHLAPLARRPTSAWAMDPRFAFLSCLIQLVDYSDSVGNFNTMRFVEKMTEFLINY